MKIICHQCGTGNEVEASAVSAGLAACRRCQGRLRMPEPARDTAANAPPEFGESAGAHAWLSALGETPAPAPIGQRETRPADGLEALFGAPEDLTQSAPMDFGGGGFVFGEEAPPTDESTWLQSSAPVDFSRRADPQDDESTRIVANPGHRPMPRPTNEPSWRIRGERGLVYEMQSVDAVVAWLEGRSQIHGVTIARGDGDFKSISAFAEISKRLGKRAQPKAPPVDDAPLSLAMDPAEARRASSARSQMATAPAESIAEPRTSNRGKATSARAQINVANPVGFGGVLMVMLAAVALVVGGISVGVLWGGLAPPEVSPAAQATALADNPALDRAIAEVEKGNDSAATKILRGLSAKNDPRVDRYLALVLHRTGRAREAREALARYRRGMMRVSRGHGRQVREVRH